MKITSLIIGGVIILTPIIGLNIILNNSNNSKESKIVTLCEVKENKKEIEVKEVKIIKRIGADIFFKKQDKLTFIDRSNCYLDITISNNQLNKVGLNDFNKSYNLKIYGGDYPKFLSLVN